MKIYIEKTKKCCRCNQIKNKIEFGKRNNKKDKLCPHCKSCDAIYYMQNKEKIDLKHKLYYFENKDKLKPTRQKWHQNNKEKRNKRNLELINKRRNEDLNYKMRCLLKQRILIALRSNMKIKAPKAEATIGCTVDFFKKYIEGLFKEGMNWNNHGRGEGKWSIDHIMPASSFDLADVEQQKKCSHYTNLQPLWDFENVEKHNKIINK